MLIQPYDQITDSFNSGLTKPAADEKQLKSVSLHAITMTEEKSKI